MQAEFTEKGLTVLALRWVPQDVFALSTFEDRYQTVLRHHALPDVIVLL